MYPGNIEKRCPSLKDRKGILYILRDNYSRTARDSHLIEDALLDFHPGEMHNKQYNSVGKVKCLLLLEGGYIDSLKAQYCLLLEGDLTDFPEESIDPVWFLCQKLLNISWNSANEVVPMVLQNYKRIGIGALNTRIICASANKSALLSTAITGTV